MNHRDNVKITWELAITDPAGFCPVTDRDDRLEFRQAGQPCAAFNWFLFQAVGEQHRWGGRGDWNRQQWSDLIDRDEFQTWVGYVEGTPAGYAELERQDDGSVRILCFGLLPDFIGRGLGSRLLSETVERAWAMGANRVWLRTCSHDHPHALPNYQARGFELVEETTSEPNPALTSILFTSGTEIDESTQGQPALP